MISHKPVQLVVQVKSLILKEFGVRYSDQCSRFYDGGIYLRSSRVRISSTNSVRGCTCL